MNQLKYDDPSSTTYYAMRISKELPLKEWCAGKEAKHPMPHVLLSPALPESYIQ